MNSLPLSATRSQQNKALWTSTFAFTVCFAVWTIFSIIGIQIKKELGLSDTQFGLLAATPILTGSIIRLFLGVWTEQYGGRIVFSLVMLAAAVATWMLTYATTYPQFLMAALAVGIAGGSFAVGIAYVSKWFPAGKQGTALGIFGAGNVGAAVTKLLAPMVMVAYGWHGVARFWSIGLAVTAIIFFLFTKDDPGLAKRRAEGVKPVPFVEQMKPLRNLQVWRFSLYYFFVFGAFVALALWLPRYLTGAYGLDVKTAGLIAACYSIPASLFRVVGGWISDKVGGSIVTQVISAVMVAASVAVGYVMMQAYQSATPEQYFPAFLGLFVVLFAASGIGNGSTFRTIGVIFDRAQAGPVLGWTSAIAAYGAFIAPIVIGDQIKAGTPQFAMYGFAAFYAVCLVLNWWFYLRPNAYVKNP